MSAQKKNLNLNNIPEPLIRRARAAAASEGKPLYAWAIEAFEEKINFDHARDPGSVTERLVNAIQALGGSGSDDERAQMAFSILAPLLTSDFPSDLQEDIEALMNSERNQLAASKLSEALTGLLMKIWGPSWYR